jgi:hypothetical protein
MDLAQQIQTMARAGHSKQHTMELLGFTRYSFESALELIGPVEWPTRGRSLTNMAAHADRRGRFTPGMARSCVKAGEARKAKASRTVRGVIGTIDELVAHFKVGVSACTVRRRLVAGMSLEQALFTPRSRKSGLGKHLGKRSMTDEQWAAYQAKQRKS